MNVHFSRVETSDLPVIKTIYDWYITNSTATFHIEPIQQDELQEFVFINHDRYPSCMIHLDNELAGYCFLTPHKKRPAYNRTAEISIYLKEGYTRKGIGMVALNHLEKLAKEIRLKNLIGVITGDNLESIRLFEKAGYKKCAHFKNVGEKFNKVLDVVAYQKELE